MAIPRGHHENLCAIPDDVWHLHVHVYPRWADDRLHEQHRSARWVLATDWTAHVRRSWSSDRRFEGESRSTCGG